MGADGREEGEGGCGRERGGRVGADGREGGGWVRTGEKSGRGGCGRERGGGGWVRA